MALTVGNDTITHPGTVDGTCSAETIIIVETHGHGTCGIDDGTSETGTATGLSQQYGTITEAVDGIVGYSTVLINFLGTVAMTTVGTLLGNCDQVKITPVESAGVQNATDADNVLISTHEFGTTTGSVQVAGTRIVTVGIEAASTLTTITVGTGSMEPIGTDDGTSSNETTTMVDWKLGVQTHDFIDGDEIHEAEIATGLGIDDGTSTVTSTVVQNAVEVFGTHDQQYDWLGVG